MASIAALPGSSASALSLASTASEREVAEDSLQPSFRDSFQCASASVFQASA